jgi:phage gpG-like protein
VIEISFEPWSEFHARKKDIKGWLQRVAAASEGAFRKGASRQWAGGKSKGSQPGQWPMQRSGGLLGSIKTEVGALHMTIGTNQEYSSFLREGTSRMHGRRKMSDDALKEGMSKARLGKWVEWSR